MVEAWKKRRSFENLLIVPRRDASVWYQMTEKEWREADDLVRVSETGYPNRTRQSLGSMSG